jgi:multidrug efflux pump subunit AcrA (membrane-fusion protein)
MKFKTLFTSILLLLILTACTPEATETPEPNTDLLDFTPIVSVSGEIVPVQKATLSGTTLGIALEVTVEEGDSVSEGDVLVRMKGEEQVQAAIAAATFELTAARLALDEINDRDYALLAAQARATMDATQEQLDDLQNTDLQQALALQAIADAEKAVEEAGKAVNREKSSASQSLIDAAEAQVVLARDALDKARDDFEPYEDKPDDNLIRANFQARLAAAQQNYDAAVRRLNALMDTGSETDLAVAEANFATAQANLAQTQRDWDDLKDGPDPEDIALLEAQITNYEKDWNDLLAGPDPDEIALAEARIANAEVQLTAAQARLEDLTIRAPFSGTISELYIETSEWIAPGQPIIVLADLANLIVETTDLSEIDVALIELGKTATVSFDALPNIVVSGMVTSIAPKASEGAGVNYTVLLDLSEIPPGLRWGMTAFVDIEVE